MAIFATSSQNTPAPSGTLPPELQKAMSRVTEVSSLPEVTSRIVEIVEDPRATTREIRDLVQSDPALATRILKVVNSAFYGLPAQIASLERAILMLGLSVVKNLALAASLSQLIKGGRITEHFEARDLWRHCLAVGVCARLIAKSARVVQPDEAFVAGLVHDMGLLVTQQVFSEKVTQIAQICTAEPQDYRAVERQIIGADHEAFGGALAAKWKFPAGLRNAIAHHHEPCSLQPEFQKVAAAVYLADVVAARSQIGYWLTAGAQEIESEILALAEIQEDQLLEIAEQLPDAVTEAEQVFGAG